MDGEKGRSECDQLVAVAAGGAKLAFDDLEARRGHLAAARQRDQRPLRRFWLKYRRNSEIPRLERAVAAAEKRLDDCGQRRRLAGELGRRLSGPQTRHASIEAARAEAKRARLERKGNAYAAALATPFSVDRRELTITRRDYRRGNGVDNHIRAQWVGRIGEAFGKRCFVCLASNELTLDHLWLTKNEGGNFAVCVTHAGALLSNVLLLCRSCNSIKGERSIECLVPAKRLQELVAIQSMLSEQMNRDPLLRRIATKWYGVSIGLTDIGSQCSSASDTGGRQGLKRDGGLWEERSDESVDGASPMPADPDNGQDDKQALLDLTSPVNR